MQLILSAEISFAYMHLLYPPADLIPAPWSQLHSHWVKDMAPKPPQHSCRSKLAVPLLTRGNAQLAVQLRVSSKEDGEGMKHVMQVSGLHTTQCDNVTFCRCRLGFQTLHALRGREGVQQALAARHTAAQSPSKGTT